MKVLYRYLAIPFRLFSKARFFRLEIANLPLKNIALRINLACLCFEGSSMWAAQLSSFIEREV